MILKNGLDQPCSYVLAANEVLIVEEPMEHMDVLNQGSCRKSNIHCIINEIYPSVPDFFYVAWLAFTVHN